MNKKIKKILREILSNMPIKKSVNTPIMLGNLLDNRTALITGGSSGIGLEIAKEFARNGANIIILGRNIDKLKKATNLIKNVNQKIEVNSYQIDISLEKDISSFFEKIEHFDNQVDILVNNAGVICEKDFWNVTEEEFDRVINTNLRGTYFFTRRFCKYLINNKIKGNILNVSSSSSLRPALTPYHFTKWSIRAFTKGLAKEVSKYGIVVNGIAPGPTATDMLFEGSDNINNLGSPIGRYSTPQEIANLSCVLVSSLSESIVGDTIFATGGSGLLTYDDWD